MCPQPAPPPLQTYLEIPPDARFLPVLTAYVEQAVTAVGFGPAEARALTLAAEEILGYLTHRQVSGRPLRVACAGQAHQVSLSLDLDPSGVALHWFNLTSRVDLDQDDDLSADIGLVIAGRIVDRLSLSRAGDALRLVLVKERVYPDPPPAPDLPPADPAVSCRAPDGAELGLALAVLRARQGAALPHALAHPDRMRDRIAAGAWDAAVAVDAAGRLGGLLVWRWTSDRLVDCLGPWLFDGQPPATARLLLDHLLGRLARSSCIGLVSRHAAPDLPDGFFETLGTLTHTTGDENAPPAETPVHFRHLEEDLGAVTWTDPRLRPFLVEAYDRMAFARDLYEVPAASDDDAAADAVLAADSDRNAGTVTLRPLWWGADAPRLVADHVTLLRREGLRDLRCELDLGQSWQARFGPALLDAGFVPRLVIPHAGQGDLLILQHDGRDRP
jgi:hypothetical protein